MLVIVREQLERTGVKIALFIDRFAVLALPLKPCDPVINQARDGGVLAHDDEDGRDADTFGLPFPVMLFIVGIERVKRRHQHRRQVERVLRPQQVFADVLPEVAIDRVVCRKAVVRHGHPRQLHDAALDGIHQAEIGNHPGKQRAFLIARPTKEERGG